MTVETIKDILELTRRLHSNLADKLQRAAKGIQQEKLRMLLDYLSQHEQELSRILALSEKDAEKAALQTWCAEYFDKHPFKLETWSSLDFANMNTGEVMRSLLTVHDEIIDLYRYLSTRAEVSSTEELLTGLLALEQHEIMRMIRDTEKLEDL